MTPRSRSSRGHTLLEMTIALALGMLIVTASLLLYRGQRDAFDRAAETARIHDAAAIALDMLGQQIQMAGFTSSADATVDAPLFGCAQGRVAGADTAASCESLAGRSDGLQTRYAGDAVSTWPTNAGVPTDCIGQAVSDDIVTNRFYAKASSSTGEPELYCEGGGKQAQPIVEGIERIRVTYWLKGASSAMDASAIARDRWRDAYAAEICVLVRGSASHAKRRTRYTDCSGLPAYVEDGRVRQAFWRRVAIRNSPENASGGAQ
ncbi:prepilin-type cleavage/methylation-like protein [Caballeronia fortuita]|uniref:Prepilin-type cleavage/methylation-like protein n=1 Tax=Caballeronia fortuita TaxID=1777138 RepID=A0A158BQJ4_9BURK|nr:type IV pilus assembly protein [Caballeronia fortuita]SAK72368.1 prepilin-type cleavage/methylation-like protein [Caballeronia fortuita]